MKTKPPTDSATVRAGLVEALGLDLVGPRKGDPLGSEVLDRDPSRWYLTGFLAPSDAPGEQREDPTAQEDVAAQEPGGVDDDAAPEPAAARRVYFPSSLGVSVLVPGDARALEAVARWGDYEPRGYEEGSARGLRSPLWARTQREVRTVVTLPTPGLPPAEAPIEGSNGLVLVTSCRAAGSAEIGAGMVPDGTLAVSVFLVNRRRPAPDEIKDAAFAFQVELELRCAGGFVARPNLRGLDTDDWDERVADLQHRGAFEFAVGHGVSTHAEVGADGRCETVRTCWVPQAEVERVAPTPIAGVELGMEALAGLPDGAAARERLGGLVAAYREWIAGQEGALGGIEGRRLETARELLVRAHTAADRIEAGIALLADPAVLRAFTLANRAMAAAARQRFGPIAGLEPEKVEAPAWRPFQLAFILMNLRAVADPVHADRGIVDLLFFPTGGGKTEAYLGLAAFTLVLRRLRHPGLTSAGVSVLMRYTLRLLTLDQLGRAATLICALELERQKAPEELGEWPFEVGLWVGRAATPNRMGAVGDGNRESARARAIAYKNNDSKPSPIPLENCPWCGRRFTSNSFNLVPGPDRPRDLRINCVNRRCAFVRNPLPIVAVDEPIYRRLPCFLIATVDKFAALPWTGEVGGFFGHVTRYDREGFYGAAQPGQGTPLPAPLPPPDLVIQDELHLISGPMGTMVGLYEAALDELCARQVDGHTVRPKVVASTATVRRAVAQIQALFDRREVDVFPPPGPDVRDSFFARTLPASDRRPPGSYSLPAGPRQEQGPGGPIGPSARWGEGAEFTSAPRGGRETSPCETSSARLYVGVAAPGRSLKVILLRTYLALLGAAQKAYVPDGGARNPANAADPFMTLVGYFSSLRELGGSRRIVEDEVTTRLASYGDRRRDGESEGLFADRKIAYEVLELTSRVSTAKVADAKRRLGLPFHEPQHVDVALATNMISVGLDILRLGLMVVLGQPKTTAEYIQATSRVGRDPARPGLIVTLFNVHRPRDRSHYERFAAYHQSFYRDVEATSVTPFSPRALDRGLPAVAVGLARHLDPALSPPVGAAAITTALPRLGPVSAALAERAARHTAMAPADADALRQTMRTRTQDLLDSWSRLAAEQEQVGNRLQYQVEVGGAQRLLHDVLSPELPRLRPIQRKFRAHRSMRDVEPSVNLWLKTLDGQEIEAEGDDE